MAWIGKFFKGMSAMGPWNGCAHQQTQPSPPRYQNAPPMAEPSDPPPRRAEYRGPADKTTLSVEDEARARMQKRAHGAAGESATQLTTSIAAISLQATTARQNGKTYHVKAREYMKKGNREQALKYEQMSQDEIKQAEVLETHLDEINRGRRLVNQQKATKPVATAYAALETMLTEHLDEMDPEEARRTASRLQTAQQNARRAIGSMSAASSPMRDPSIDPARETEEQEAMLRALEEELAREEVPSEPEPEPESEPEPQEPETQQPAPVVIRTEVPAPVPQGVEQKATTAAVVPAGKPPKTQKTLAGMYSA